MTTPNEAKMLQIHAIYKNNDDFFKTPDFCETRPPKIVKITKQMLEESAVEVNYISEVFASENITEIPHKPQYMTPDDSFRRAAGEMKSLFSKLQQIESKNKCIRVRFLDWLSLKLKNASTRIKSLSDRIDSPCLIKIK